ncbi:hypothetical protein GLOIN_2v1785090 [Rhizophagus irregularis DAOM 181602=DAOM 197198]|uniref:Uncharacterized protein n=1 Tax=Rhizophagus irregularis (strain DAOM 197198w) TaxID=1432141 RepID=A0A015K9R8_RHIIW|nr:hypothetical protein RirG_218290 [Rhizophagus irregularis DAOM 197198w]GBC16881.2 hypothetical protein GLOIN_2v1785090 [Rhizophagus irregularis DAOM 181602=DAOM 197198]
MGYLLLLHLSTDHPCSLTVDQKKSCCEFIAILLQLPPNTKDIHLAFLMCEIGVMAVNVPLSLNSYKLKKWTYITFKSQQMMDTTMKQSIALQGRRFTWELLQNTNKLCHRCGKLRCAPIACRFHSQSKDRSNSHQRSYSSSKPDYNDNVLFSGHNQSLGQTNFSYRPKSNEQKSKDRSVFFSNTQPNGTLSSHFVNSNRPLVNPNCLQIQEILSVLEILQKDLASVCARVHALELADQRIF